jgi:diguanylate cyclase (GGDEF)-like protein
MSHLDWSLRRAKLDNLSGAVLKLDLDRFKDVNDTLGSDVGDMLLKEISQRLKESIRCSDTVGWFGKDKSKTSLCRIGGNEFSVLFPEIKHIEDIELIAQRILQAIEPPCHPRQHELYITISIGISVFPKDGSDINTLIKHADIAISHAKQQGGNNVQFYSDKINSQSVEQLTLTNQLRKASVRKELELFYQPKVDAYTGEITGAEALMRWNHPKLGLVSPGIFIPLAEKSGLLPDMDDWAFRTACQQLIDWQTSGLSPIPVSVNVTSQSFRNGRVVKTVRDALEITGLNPKYIKLELTESTIMDNAEENIKMLHRLKDLGIKLSIDDFGTGYSSLSYLNRFPLDELKIDQTFISGLPSESSNLAIVKAIIAMARSLGLHVIAEGGETQEQLTTIQELNCTEYQGYLFSKPVPVDEFKKLRQLGVR